MNSGDMVIISNGVPHIDGLDGVSGCRRRFRPQVAALTTMNVINRHPCGEVGNPIPESDTIDLIRIELGS